MSTPILGVTDQDFSFIIQTIRKYFPQATITVFGSRIYGTPKKYSDLDICLKDKSSLDFSQWEKLSEELAESDIPFLVDISDFSLLTEDFKRLVLEKGIRI